MINAKQIKNKIEELQKLLELYENREVNIEISPRQTGKTTRALHYARNNHDEYDYVILYTMRVSLGVEVYRKHNFSGRCNKFLIGDKDVVKYGERFTKQQSLESFLEDKEDPRRILVICDEFDYCPEETQKVVAENCFDTYISTTPRFSRNPSYPQKANDYLFKLVEIYGYTSVNTPRTKGFYREQSSLGLKSTDLFGNMFEA